MKWRSRPETAAAAKVRRAVSLVAKASPAAMPKMSAHVPGFLQLGQLRVVVLSVIKILEGFQGRVGQCERVRVIFLRSGFNGRLARGFAGFQRVSVVNGLFLLSLLASGILFFLSDCLYLWSFLFRNLLG